MAGHAVRVVAFLAAVILQLESLLALLALIRNWAEDAVFILAGLTQQEQAEYDGNSHPIHG